MENLRFHKEETENDPEFAKELSKLADIYINEAFSVCHRTHASIAGVPKYLSGFPGFLLEKEMSETFHQSMTDGVSHQVPDSGKSLSMLKNH